MPSFVDKEFDVMQANMTDIRAIVHALKMANLAFVEEDTATEIKQLIKNLPSAERINELSQTPEGLKDVRQTVGYILGLINSYGQRNAQSKARYKSRTNLPPRYKVLEWRSNMEKEAKSFVKELVRISSVADDRGDSKIASQTIKFAKAMVSEEIKEQDVAELVSMLRQAGYEKESDFVKEAGIGDLGKAMWQGVKNLGGKVNNALFDPVRLQRSRDKLDQIMTAINSELQVVQQLAQKAVEPAKSQIQEVFNGLSSMQNKGNGAIVALNALAQNPPAQQAQAPQSDIQQLTDQVSQALPQAGAQQASQPQADPSANPVAEIGQQFQYWPKGATKSTPLTIQSDGEQNAYVEIPDVGPRVLEKGANGKWNPNMSREPVASPEDLAGQMVGQQKNIQSVPDVNNQVNEHGRKVVPRKNPVGNIKEIVNPQGKPITPYTDPTTNSTNKFNLSRYSSK